MAKHPWSLGGGGAAELKGRIEAGRGRLGEVADVIGFASFIGLDDAYIVPPFVAKRTSATLFRPLVVGESVRDWTINSDQLALTPYDTSSHEPLQLDPQSWWGRFLWPNRTVAEGVLSFGLSSPFRR